MPNLTFAIIGCQHLHIQEFVEEMLKMGHCCKGIYEESNVRLRKKISDKFNLPVFHSIEDVLNERLDIVGSASVNKEKIEVIERCEKLGIHVMVDKPIIHSEETFTRLKKVLSRGSIQVGMMLTERFQPHFMELKRMIDNDMFGKITHLSLRKPHKLSKDFREEWFFKKEQSGGIIMDLCIHDFDLIRWLTQKEVTSISGYMSKNILFEYPDFFDLVQLQVLLDEEIPVQLYADWHTPSASWTWGDGRVFITGTKGCAELRLQGDPYISSDPLLIYTSHEQQTRIIDLPNISTNISEDFVSRLKGEPHFITHKDILMATLATLKADRCAIRVGCK